MKIVYIGLNHRPNDPRLYHREMKVLKQEVPESEIYFLNREGLIRFNDLETYGTVGSPVKGNQRRPVPVRLLLAVRRGWREWSRYPLYVRRVRKIAPAVVQASDAREIILALLLKVFCGSKIIYDSHEDYYNQVLDYKGRSLAAYFWAVPIKVVEILFLRCFDYVFCTDDFLCREYQKAMYGCKKVHLLRNFPRVNDQWRPRTYLPKDELRLVYIGSVNIYRGVVECSRYVERFNDEHGGRRKLTFFIYSSTNDVVEQCSKRVGTSHVAWLDYSELIKELNKYDVGVCLWRDIKKFRRNLPLKNFDYMAAGLPIITSNFGNLKEYAERSGSALCIDPDSYEQFESAVLTLFDSGKRKAMGRNGQRYVVQDASFEREAETYVAAIRREFAQYSPRC